MGTIQRRFTRLAAVLAAAITVVVMIAIFILYQTALNGERARLLDAVTFYAALIDEHNSFHANDPSETLAMIQAAASSTSLQSESAEIVIGQRDGNEIIFLVHRSDRILQIPVQHSHLAEPMRRALIESSASTVIATDYRGIEVVAAYAPIHSVSWGLVVKVDLVTVRKPYLIAAAWAVVCAGMILGIGLVAVRSLSHHIIARFDTQNRHIAEIFHAVGRGIVVIGVNGRIRHFNPAAEKLFGYPAEAIVGQNVSTLIPPGPHRDGHDEYLRAALLDGKSHIFGKSRDVVALRRDGTTVPISLAVSPAEIAGEQCFIGVVEDISARLAAEHMLDENQALLRDIVNLAPLIIAVKDVEGRYLFANCFMANLYGMSPTELEGHMQHELHPVSDELIGFSRADERVLTGRCEVTNIPEEQFTDTHGRRHILHTTKMPLRWKGEPAVLVVASDITDRVEAERQQHEAEVMAHAAEEANRLQSAFLSSMSHELRTPLSTILGFPPIMEELLLDLRAVEGAHLDDIDELLSLTRRIEDRGGRLLALINDLLDIAKAEAGGLVLHIEPHVAESIILPEIEALIPQAAEKGLTLTLDCDPDLAVLADDHRLRQIVTNLISNALKFTDAGGITVTAVSGNTHAAFTVADTGCGIAEGDLGKVFDRFQQVGDHAKQKKGTGLGLAITRELVERMGGIIRVTSCLGEGSEFTFTLPLYREES